MGMRLLLDNYMTNWHLLKINNEIYKVFTEKPIIAYRRNKNIQDLIGSNTIENNKVKRKRKVNLNVYIIGGITNKSKK